MYVTLWGVEVHPIGGLLTSFRVYQFTLDDENIVAAGVTVLRSQPKIISYFSR